MRSPKVIRAVLFLLLTGFSIATLWVAVLRTTHPRALNGVVSRVEVRHEKHAGVDDVYVMHIGGREIVVTEQIGKVIKPGDRVFKRRWSLELVTPSGEWQIPPSIDLLNLPGAVIAAGLAGAVLLVQRRRTPWRPDPHALRR